MINSYFKTSLTRQPITTTYSTTRLVQERSIFGQKYRKYKLIVLLLAKATYRQMRETVELISSNQKRIHSNLSKIVTFSEKNLNMSTYLAFQKIKTVGAGYKNEQKVFKNIINLLQRMEKYKVKQCFNKLVLHCARATKTIIENITSNRAYQLHRKLVCLYKRRKKQTLNTLVAWSKFLKSYSKVRVIAVIHNRFQKQLKQQFFTRLTRYLLVRNRGGGAERAVNDLKTQLQDMNVQLQNKNQNIQRLQQQLTQIKIQQSNMSSYQNLSYGEYNNDRSRRGAVKSFSQKKLSFNDKSIGNKSINDSNDGLSLNDMSIGSILGNLNKSRTGSISKYDPNSDCSCGYKPRYQKYKNLNESLKNQLQIVKEQLQVAKDLNQHFTNEIKQYLSGELGDGDYQKLKKQNKALQQQRDQLREKVFKYQKHIANLKSEFKVKMQQLYRKVRKDM